MKPRQLLSAAAVTVMLGQCEPECAPAPADLTSWTVNWDNVAQCESGGRWDYGIVSNSSGSYSGGLMIGTRWWDAHGGEEFADHAGLATKSQQIIVAERIVDANGGGYAGADKGWQCVR